MLTVEKEGKTVEEAISKAILELGAEREDVEIEIIRQESSGVLSFLGGHSAVVRVTKVEGIEDRITKILLQLFQQMNISVQFHVQNGEDSCQVDVESAGVDGLLIALANLDACNTCGVVMSWAEPGQGGHGHVNEQLNRHAVDWFSAHGYFHDKGTQEMLRQAAEIGWFRNTIMVFRKHP